MNLGDTVACAWHHKTILRAVDLQTEQKLNKTVALNLYVVHTTTVLFISDSLQDEHILELSKRIPDQNKLMEFGIKVLMFEEDTIKAVIYDHSDSIQAATHELLSKWLSQQPSRQEAYIHLQSGLKRAKMNQLAGDLKMKMEISAEESQVTDGSK